MTGGETLALLAVGTFFALPTLLAVPLTQAILRRMERVAPVAVIERGKAIDIDEAPAEMLLQGILATLQLAPAAAEGIVRIDHDRLDGVGDGQGFTARNDRLARAAMTTHLIARILRWVARPSGMRRLGAAFDAARILTVHSDEDGLIDNVARFESFLAKNPPEPEPKQIVVTA